MKGNKKKALISQTRIRVICVALLCLVVVIFVRWDVQETRTTPLALDPPKIKTNVDGFRMCLIGGLKLGGEPVKTSTRDVPLPVRFQCAGTDYEQFANDLERVVRLQSALPDLAQWARRPLPIPPPPARGSGNQAPMRHVLFMGSTHLRQVLAALLCQYADQVVKVERLHNTGKYSPNSISIHVTLQQNVNLYAVFNPPFIYTDEWQHYLEEHILQRPLEMMDAIVLSKFHTYSNDRHAQPFLEFLQDHERIAGQEKATVHADPPSFLDVTNAYHGPVIYVSLFAAYGEWYYDHVQRIIDALEEGKTIAVDESKTGAVHEIDWEFAKNPTKHQGISEQAEKMFTPKVQPPKIGSGQGGNRRRRLEEEEGEDPDREAAAGEEKEEKEVMVEAPLGPKRTNLMLVDGRKYVPKLGECSTNSHKTVGTCITDVQDKWFSQGHRCFGGRGGHPDLISYDLIEALYKVLKPIP